MDEAYINKVEINVNNGGQVNIAEGNAVVAAVQNNCNGANSIKQKIKSRTLEYADKWNENMFLNNFDEWDENAGVNVKLSDVYIDDHLPHFIWGCNEDESKNLKNLLSKYVSKSKENKMLLILGQPGIGKSTLITWITANFHDQIDNILVYKFASDLKTIDWRADNVSRAILDKVGLVYDDLNNKTLILDGFDEIIAEKDRKDILDSIYWEFIKRESLKNFSLVITCRENYIDGFERIKCNYITLQPWDEVQIVSFCQIFKMKTENYTSETTIRKLLENKEIFGIPLILYMVSALNISIEEEGSIVDVYDKIFALAGGIYDRCIDNKSFAEPHRIGKVKQQIHQISRAIAIWMFENEPEEAYIPKNEYQKICNSIVQEENQEKKDIQKDFLIGNYFRLVKHCEGLDMEALYFVHRSIYEYFVAETITSSIKKYINDLPDGDRTEFIKIIGYYLQKGYITNTICEYLNKKITKIYAGMNDAKKDRFYEWWEETVGEMLNVGMFYYAGNSISEYKNIITREAQCFENLMIILRLLQFTNKSKYILEHANTKQLEKYIWLIESEKRQQGRLEDINLSNFSLEHANLRGIEYKFTYLQDANLGKADLSRTKFKEINMKNTILSGTNLREADLRGADLRGVNMQQADLGDANLTRADLRGADLYKTNLLGTKLNYSLWLEEDVLCLASELEKAEFSQIIVENNKNERRTAYKNEIC